MGRNNGWQGRHHSAATKAKISAANRARAGSKVSAPKAAKLPGGVVRLSGKQTRAAQSARAKPVSSHPGAPKQLQDPKRNKTTTRVMKNVRAQRKVRDARINARINARIRSTPKAVKLPSPAAAGKKQGIRYTVTGKDSYGPIRISGHKSAATAKASAARAARVKGITGVKVTRSTKGRNLG